MPIASTQIAALHAEYCRLTGAALPLRVDREACWFEWLRRGLTLDDLKALIADKRQRIHKGDLTIQSLSFRNLVGNVDYAEEDALMLRAKNRGPKQDPARQSVLKATGKVERHEQPVRTAAEVLAGQDWQKQLAKLKAQLKP